MYYTSKSFKPMTNDNSQQPPDEMTPALRKALVECGAIIPITPEEVFLAEKQLSIDAEASHVDSAFKALEDALDDPSKDLSFMRLDDSVAPQKGGDLAMAARNGDELDEETRAKIEESVRKALRKPRQD
jgi:hypothetical protein